MQRSWYLDLAARGLRMPIGAHLVLHTHADAEQIVLDGDRLGRVIEETARRFRTPLAIPLMDLRLEKADLLAFLNIPESEVDLFHFHEPLDNATLGKFDEYAGAPFPLRNQAHLNSLRYIANQTDLAPVGMAIGPFSLTTKLLADPITLIAMSGTGVTAADDPGVRMLGQCLELAERALRRSLAAQIAAGIKAVLICEPAANVIYLSPKQIERGADIFERFVMQPALRFKAQLAAAGVDLIFHDCGQLADFMVCQFAGRLDPAILSLGGSRRLWEDAALVPKDVVLFGNLPTKNFYSDEAMPMERVESLTLDLIERMRAAGHPHITGSECDVLHVPESAAAIWRKVDLMMSCGTHSFQNT